MLFLLIKKNQIPYVELTKELINFKLNTHFELLGQSHWKSWSNKAVMKHVIYTWIKQGLHGGYPGEPFLLNFVLHQTFHESTETKDGVWSQSQSEFTRTCRQCFLLEDLFPMLFSIVCQHGQTRENLV